MAVNILSRKYDELELVTTKLTSGLVKHGADIDVKRDPDPILEALAAAKTTNTDFYASMTERVTLLTPALDAADAEGKAFLGAAIKVFRVHFGNTWNHHWNAIGLTGKSTAVPRTRDSRTALIKSIGEYLTENPNHANAELDVTVERAVAILAELKTATEAVSANKLNQATIGKARTKAMNHLRGRIRATITDLKSVLEEDSPLWESFGVKAPYRASREEMKARAERTSAKDQRAVERALESADRTKQRADEKVAKAIAKANRNASDSTGTTTTSRQPVIGSIPSGSGATTPNDDVELAR
jgi:hypothetical protein